MKGLMYNSIVELDKKDPLEDLKHGTWADAIAETNIKQAHVKVFVGGVPAELPCFSDTHAVRVLHALRRVMP